MRITVFACIILTGLLSACSEGDSAASKTDKSPGVSEFPVFESVHLQHGKSVWEANCKVCHATGLAGAPRITDKKAWAARIAQGKSVLHEHALNGFMGKSGTEMPARGGNDELTDEQVKAAVDYMQAASQ